MWKWQLCFLCFCRCFNHFFWSILLNRSWGLLRKLFFSYTTYHQKVLVWSVVNQAECFVCCRISGWSDNSHPSFATWNSPSSIQVSFSTRSLSLCSSQFSLFQGCIWWFTVAPSTSSEMVFRKLEILTPSRSWLAATQLWRRNWKYQQWQCFVDSKIMWLCTSPSTKSWGTCKDIGPRPCWTYGYQICKNA